MQRIRESIKMLKEKRMGFVIDETMTGYHRFERLATPSEKKFMEFKVSWGPKNIAAWINPYSSEFMVQPLWGHVTIEGLCHQTPCKGTLELKYFDEHIIRYTFEFKVKGKEYVFIGEKVNIQVWNLPVSHTTCFGRLTEKTTGRLVSTSVTYFKFSTMIKFLSSLRFG
ncbi:MAG: hypothetical protein HQM16_13165 [Deltaproteobacteria bacterium]|nr:hypothetical protein [Deltaproteobacteria bacterium]